MQKVELQVEQIKLSGETFALKGVSASSKILTTTFCKEEKDTADSDSMLA